MLISCCTPTVSQNTKRVSILFVWTLCLIESWIARVVMCCTSPLGENDNILITCYVRPVHLPCWFFTNKHEPQELSQQTISVSASMPKQDALKMSSTAHLDLHTSGQRTLQPAHPLISTPRDIHERGRKHFIFYSTQTSFTENHL